MEKIHRHFRIIVVEDYEKMGVLAAGQFAKQIASKPASIIGLATGSTPLSTYKNLIELCGRGEVDFKNVTSFNLDEYYPIKKSSLQSYDYFMRENLFDYINIAPENVFIPDGEAVDAEKACRDYESRIKNAGGIDLQLLGLGNNGHIGFNEPSDVFPKTTHCVTLDEITIKANARFFDSADDVPKQALSMGIGTIMDADHILLLISGAAKADIAGKVLFGDITPRVPGSVLQLHRSVTVILDKGAAEQVVSYL